MPKTETYVPEVQVVKEQVAAQVSKPRKADASKVQVHEVSVRLDRVITDPNSADAVQVPEATDIQLPIHRLSAPSAEGVFAGEEPAEGQETAQVESSQATPEDDARRAS